MLDEKDAVGERLHLALRPFHAAQGKVLTAVLLDQVDGAEILTLVFSSEGLSFRSDADLDVITSHYGLVEASPDAEDLSDGAWSAFLGREFSAGWLTLNQRGNTDGVLLSFDGVVPEIGVNVIASRFETLEIRQPAG